LFLQYDQQTNIINVISTALETQLDLVVVPGVAFDSQCNRLGHGKGYYDSFFAEYQEKNSDMPFLVGMALSDQMVEIVPTMQHDVPLNAVVTPTDLIRRCKG
jgi:5-formyltetrahydrofolate cyclo-ligase